MTQSPHSESFLMFLAACTCVFAPPRSINMAKCSTVPCIRGCRESDVGNRMCVAVQGLKAATVHIRRGRLGEQQALSGTLSGLNDVSACLAAQHTNAGASPCD